MRMRPRLLNTSWRILQKATSCELWANTAEIGNNLCEFSIQLSENSLICIEIWNLLAIVAGQTLDDALMLRKCLLAALLLNEISRIYAQFPAHTPTHTHIKSRMRTILDAACCSNFITLCKQRHVPIVTATATRCCCCSVSCSLFSVLSAGTRFAALTHARIIFKERVNSPLCFGRFQTMKYDSKSFSCSCVSFNYQK